jgi:membrane protein YdbS with pleckstrin-like domain
MLPQSYLRSLLHGTTALLIINALLAITCTCLCAVMLYAIARNPQWEFVAIALVALVLADQARTLALRQLRNRRLWKSYLSESTH